MSVASGHGAGCEQLLRLAGAPGAAERRCVLSPGALGAYGRGVESAADRGGVYPRDWCRDAVAL